MLGQSIPSTPPFTPFLAVPSQRGDEACRVLSGEGFEVWYRITRRTRGWHRVEAVISSQDFQRACGIESEETLQCVLEELVAKGFILLTPAAAPHRHANYALLDAGGEVILPLKRAARARPASVSCSALDCPGQAGPRLFAPQADSLPDAAPSPDLPISPPQETLSIWERLRQMAQASAPATPPVASAARSLPRVACDHPDALAWEERQAAAPVVLMVDEEDAGPPVNPTPCEEVAALWRQMKQLNLEAGDAYCAMASSTYGTSEYARHKERLYELRLRQLRLRWELRCLEDS